ncbi:MAG TPA: hypothetical protein DCM86_07770 [Verrucomicrobiales bacterium]|nr:hypothetical protein [Verrucomicrobiales bacterium]
MTRAYDGPGNRLYLAEQGRLVNGTWTHDPAQIYTIDIPDDPCFPGPFAKIEPKFVEYEVSWPTQSNRLYSVDYHSTLTTNNWVSLRSGLVGVGGVTSIVDRVAASEARRFYRVVCAPNTAAPQ